MDDPLHLHHVTLALSPLPKALDQSRQMLAQAGKNNQDGPFLHL
jgi:hypothetical protein